jgi:hypothetical protein
VINSSGRTGCEKVETTRGEVEFSEGSLMGGLRAGTVGEGFMRASDLLTGPLEVLLEGSAALGGLVEPALDLVHGGILAGGGLKSRKRKFFGFRQKRSPLRRGEKRENSKNFPMKFSNSAFVLAPAV